MRIADCGMGVWDVLRPKLLSRNEENLTPRRKDEKRGVSDGHLKLVFRLGRQILDNGLIPWRLGARLHRYAVHCV
jgi:hypothetical protein